MADFRTERTGLSPLRIVPRRQPVTGGYASVLRRVPKSMRRHAAAFANFLKLAHDVTSDAELEPEAKAAQLLALERALVEGGTVAAWLLPALELRASLSACNVSNRHAREILHAHRRDAEGHGCKTWMDVMRGCRLAAVPVGRHVLDLYGEHGADIPAADSLCTAVRLLRVVQECRADWVNLGRCHLPADWFDAAGVHPEHLMEHRSRPGVRAVLNRVLDRVDRHLERARPLPGSLRDPGLRLESAVILASARLMSRRLRRHDPLARRITLGGIASAWIMLRARWHLARSMAGLESTVPTP